ncbi:MAG: exonuclease domain-containing protein [Massilibacteroides sp.]|nr:exonuclease domain-containing protein [Massilibacteroides sp.]
MRIVILEYRRMLNFASIDFETANYNRSSICSLGIVIVENGVVVDKIYSLVRPRPNFYCSWATDIHGLSYYDTLNEPEFPEVWEGIKPKLRNLPLVVYILIKKYPTFQSKSIPLTNLNGTTSFITNDKYVYKTGDYN